jgi:hypothetical protein
MTANTSKDTGVRVTWCLPHITQLCLMLEPLHRSQNLGQDRRFSSSFS